MDAAGLFAEAVASRTYTTFEEFKAAFSAFQEATGFVYVKDNTNRFKENRPERSTIVYRNIVFCCSSYGGRGIRKKSGSMCPSRIKVSGAGGVLTVSDWNMDHNHTVQPRNLMGDDLKTEVVDDADCALAVPANGEFMAAFPQMWFSTFSEFDTRLKEFEVMSGSQYTKWKGDKFSENHPARDTLVYRRLTYACFHYGESRRRGKHRNRTQKIGCSSVIILRADNGLLRIVRFNMRHCHSVGPKYVQGKTIRGTRRSQKREILENGEDPLRVPSNLGNPDLPSPGPSVRKAHTQSQQLTREEKLSIISPYLSQLADFACDSDDIRFHRSMTTIKAIHDLWSGDSDVIVYRKSPGYEFDYQDASPPNVSAYVVSYNSLCPSASHLCKESIFYDDPI
ncbi:hypothetical protein SprV_0301177600 [Sparganum proliferum]